MAILKCKMCGGTIEYIQGATVGECQHCGTKQTLPNTTDEVVTNLFNRANNLRLKCEFDKAMAAYEKIVEQDDSQAEAHWGIVLCKYGIEYVDDPASHTKIPTCHRTLYNPVTKDTDYQATIDYADTLQQSIYEKEARAIDKIQKSILSIVQNEDPFDVFICYKETDEYGKRTKDSVLANDIYYQLTQEDFKVFYAAITLEDKLGQEYEPYIFAALNTAKVMLVIGSDPDYFNSVWVKNEWSRFMSLMNTDRSKILIPCYKDMDPYDLPEEFAHLQAQDMSKIGFINDVIRGIKKLIVKKQPSGESISMTSPELSSSLSNVNPLLERAFIFLEDKKWGEADTYCEKVLDLSPKNARAYVAKLMAELKVCRMEDLANCKQPFDDNGNYLKAIRFGDEGLTKLLMGYIDAINTRIENEEKESQLRELAIRARIEEEKKEALLRERTPEERTYKSALFYAMNSSNDYASHKYAAELFESIPGYKDSDQLKAKCLELWREGMYKQGKIEMSDGEYKEALKIFEEIRGYKETQSLIWECKDKIATIQNKLKRDENKDYSGWSVKKFFKW